MLSTSNISHLIFQFLLLASTNKWYNNIKYNPLWYSEIQTILFFVYLEQSSLEHKECGLGHSNI